MEELVAIFRSVGAGFLASAILVAPAVVFGDEEAPHIDEADHGASVEHGEEDVHGEEFSAHNIRDFKNEVAVFLGATEESGHDTEFTWGFDYKRRIADRWAVGLLFDYAGGELRNAIVAPSISYWPGLGNLQLLAAAGVEYHNGRSAGGHEKADHGGEADRDETYFLVRLGVGHDFHIGESFGLVPQVNLDFVNNEEVWVYGVAVTYGF